MISRDDERKMIKGNGYDGHIFMGACEGQEDKVPLFSWFMEGSRDSGTPKMLKAWIFPSMVPK